MSRGPEHYASDWYKMGMKYLRQNKYEKAVECFEKALSFKNDISDVWWSLGVALKNLDRIDEAETAFNRAQKLDPISAEREWKKDDAAILILDGEKFRETGKLMRVKLINIYEHKPYLLELAGQSFGDPNLCTLAVYLNGKKVESQRFRRTVNVRIPLGVLEKGEHRLGLILDTTTGYWELDAIIRKEEEFQTEFESSDEKFTQTDTNKIPFQLSDNHILQLQVDARELLLTDSKSLTKKEQIILKTRRKTGQDRFRETRRKHPLNPDNCSDWIHEALFKYVYHDEDGVVEYLENAIKIEPSNGLALEMLASLKLEHREYVEVIDMLVPNLDEEDSPPILWGLLSLAFAWKRSKRKSQHAMEIVTTQAPRDGLFLLCKALQQYRLKNIDKALSAQRKAAYFELQWPRYAIEPGKFILMRFVLRTLIPLLEKRITDGVAQTIESTTRKRMIALMKSDYDDNLISDSPDIPNEETELDAETWYDYGCACALRGEFLEAIDSIQKALHLKPEWGEAWGRLSRILMRIGKYSEGLNALRKAKNFGYIES
ncbi:MAG: tetratricopeptide repeat protein [Candidatus Thorarchaeota archaeon]